MKKRYMLPFLLLVFLFANTSQVRAELSLEEYVVAALENYETEIDVSTYNISSSEAGKEYLRILNDNPQLFSCR